ncbi:hypothetical protein Tco_1120205 [Tanacetum coccineum]
MKNKTKCFLENKRLLGKVSVQTDERIEKLYGSTSTLVEIVSKKVVTPALVKAVEETCITCGGAHSGTLPSNTIPNPKGEMKAITTRSGVAFEGPSIPTNPYPKKVVERETEETTDKEQTNFQGSTAQIPPPVTPISIPEPDVPKSLPKPHIPYHSRLNQEKSRDKASNQIEKIFQMFQDLRFDISFTDALLLMPRFAPTIRSLLMNKDKLLALSKILLCENCSVMLLKKLPEKLGDPGKFLIPSDPRVPLILGRSFLRTSRALIDVYEGELILRDGDERIIFHVDKHPQKHANKSIKMVDDTCENSFEETNNLSRDFHASKSPLEKFTDEPALVCSTPPEKDNNEEEKQEAKIIEEPTAKRRTRFTECLKNFKVIHKENLFHSKTPQISSICVFTSILPSIEPKDSLIMGDEHLSTFCVEEIVPIPRESEDTFDNNKGCDSLFVSKDDLKKDMEEDVENENSNVSNSDEPVLLHTSFPDKVECFDLGDDIDEIDAFLAMEVSMNIEEGYYDSEGDIIFLESLVSDDTTHNLSPEVFFDHEPQHIKNESNYDTLITFSPKNDPLHYEFTGGAITIPLGIVREHEDYINRMSLLCGNSSSQSPENFHTIIDRDSNREEIDIFSGPDDSIPPGGGEINVEVDDSFTFVTRTFLPYLTYLEVSPLLSSTENEDTVFDPGIST